MARRILGLLLVGFVILQLFGLAVTPPDQASGALQDLPIGPSTAYASNCIGPDGFGYTCAELVGRPYIQATTDIALHSPQGITQVTLPFSFQFYGVNYSVVNVSNQGNIQFNSGVDFNYTGGGFPGYTTDIIAPYWGNLCTDDDCDGGIGSGGNGVFIRTVGAAPNRLYVIEWRAHNFNCGCGPVYTPADTFFELQLEETTNNMYFVYGPTADNGVQSLAGIQGASGTADRVLILSDSLANLTPGRAVCFSTVAGCTNAFSTPTPTPTLTLTPTATQTSTATPTATSTATATATQVLGPSANNTATPTATLVPQPVSVSAVKAGTNRLQVTVAATGNGTLTNVQWTPSPNVSVESADGTPFTGGVINLPAGSRTATFYVRRVSGTTVTLPLTLNGSFGTWRTFVGGGPDAWQ
jgi:hypothetical protein